jgi:aminoglycoside phosphotransferase (APT) family kinase protein
MNALIAEGEVDFDVNSLSAYLNEQIGPARSTEVRPTEGGMSNPTYFVKHGDWRAVLRKPPNNILMPSAHAIDREYRVLTALQGSAVPTPKPFDYCSNRDILGTPFYLMEWLEGRVFREFATPGLDKGHRRDMYKDMCRTLAEIHKLDFRTIGLDDFGKPGNYFKRQLSRWSGLWAQYRSGDDDNPNLDKIVSWLSERVPESETLSLCHGDFRIANVMFHSAEPRVIGVLDWELSTLGHPLVDLAFNSQAWRMAPDENGGLLNLPLSDMGIPTEREYLEMYYEMSAASERLTRFHQVFAMFRGAVGSAGVAIRGDLGNGVLPDAARVGRHLAHAYASRGVALIAEDS